MEINILADTRGRSPALLPAVPAMMSTAQITRKQYPRDTGSGTKDLCLFPPPPRGIKIDDVSPTTADDHVFRRPRNLRPPINTRRGRVATWRWRVAYLIPSPLIGYAGRKPIALHLHRHRLTDLLVSHQPCKLPPTLRRRRRRRLKSRRDTLSRFPAGFTLTTNGSCDRRLRLRFLALASISCVIFVCTRRWYLYVVW